MKKSFLSLLSLTMLLSLSACGNNNSSSIAPETSSSQPESSQVETTSKAPVETETSTNPMTTTTDDPIVDEHRVSISLIGLTVNGKFDSEKTRTSFVSWYNTQAGTPDLLTDVVGEPTVETKDGGENGKIKYISLGSKTATGSLTFTFSKQIKYIAFKVSSYYKTYSYSKDGQQVTGCNVDLGCGAELFAKSTSLAKETLISEENKAPEASVISATLEQPCNKFTIQNLPSELSAGRVFLENIEVLY